MIGWLLRRWAAWQLAKDDGAGEAVAILAEVVTRGQDRAVREMAITVLNRLKTQDAINGFCRVWVETRYKDLAAILRSRRYVATETRLRVLSALKVGALDVVKRGGVEVLDFLLAALNDRDTQVATVAASCVSALENRVVIDELCRRWVENPNPELESIIRKGNYAPDEVSSRALFYFLLGEWQKYEDLDFDHSLLAKAYQSANQEIRMQVSEKAKTEGRIEWIKVLTNINFGFNIEQMTDKDWELSIDILVSYLDKKEIWNFIHNSPVIWSKHLLKKLSSISFRGFNKNEEATLKKLFNLVETIEYSDFMLPSLYSRIRALPITRLGSLSYRYSTLNRFTPEDISEIESNITNANLKEGIRNALKFTLTLIRLRQQFDIDIEDVSSDIQFSEFDIEIDE